MTVEAPTPSVRDRPPVVDRPPVLVPDGGPAVGGAPDKDLGALRIAFVGSRGVPARYGGFETAVEEVGRRLVERGHIVTVYCRSGDDDRADSYLGMNLVYLPTLRHKAVETLCHTTLSTGHLLAHHDQDVAVVLNAANAPLIPGIRAAGVPVALHVDGLEWQRAKWGRNGRRYYRAAERLAVRWSDALIADAQGIADYYRSEFGVATDLIPYGAPLLGDPGKDKIVEMGLEPDGYHLVVARFEPENHVSTSVEGYRASAATRPLIVVGSAPYAHDYTAAVRAAAGDDPRIQLVGSVWDQQQLDQLYAHALTYVHGHSVGGTNPSLLRAMGAGTSVLAYDVVFNREVLGDLGQFFTDPSALARLIESAEADPQGTADTGQALRDRAAERYIWDDVTTRYENLCRRLASGGSQRGSATGRRLGRRS
jgi:glycosyltransferase involved in cell wall biosynthesis